MNRKIILYINMTARSHELGTDVNIGLHGYSFNTNDLTKIKNGILRPSITNYGYLNGAPGTKVVKVNPTLYIDGFKELLCAKGDNVFEEIILTLVAMLGTKYDDAHDHILFFTTNKSFEKVKSSERLSHMDFEIAHVISGSDSFGICKAFVGRSVLENQDKVKTLIKFNETQGYWNPVRKENPIFSGKYIYFNSLTEAIKPKRYQQFTYSASTNKELGEKGTLAMYSIVDLPKHDQEIDDLIKKFNREILPDKMTLVSRIDLETLFGKDIKQSELRFGDLGFIKRKSGVHGGMYGLFLQTGKLKKGISNLPIKPVVEEVRPVGLSVLAFKKGEILGRILDGLKKGVLPKHSKLLDITSLIFDKNWKLLKSLPVGVKFLGVPVNINDKKINIKVMFGTDILARNNLGRLGKNKPTVKLLITNINTPMISHYTYLVHETPDGLVHSLWCNYYSNKVFLEAIRK